MKSKTMTKSELEFSVLDNDAIVHQFKEPILALVDAFGRSGQSGGSAPFVSQIISSVVKKLCMQDPISPITGKDEEWVELGHDDSIKYQNIRCSAVFKDSDGVSYYLNAIVWSGEEEYDTFTGWLDGVSSCQNIKYPFKPKTFYVDVVKHDFNEDIDADYYEDDSGWKYVYRIKDKSQLDKVFEYYVKSEDA